MAEDDRFRKIALYKKQSWPQKLYKGVRIYPEPINQGPYNTCGFCAVAKGAEMSIRKQHADAGEPCDIVICEKTLIADYCACNKIQPADIDAKKEKNRNLWRDLQFIAQNFGLLASSSRWESPVRIKVNITRFGLVDEDKLLAMLDESRSLVATIVVDPDFDELQANEIYSCEPRFDENDQLRRPFSYHAVLLISWDGENQPVIFLNSHTPETFGDDGYGHIMFPDLLKGDYEVQACYPLEALSEVRLSENQPSQRPELDAGSLHTKDSASSTSRLAYQNRPNNYQSMYRYPNHREVDEGSWIRREQSDASISGSEGKEAVGHYYFKKQKEHHDHDYPVSRLLQHSLAMALQDKKMKEEEALNRKLKARMEYAKFLQDAAKEMAKEVQTSCGGETKKTAEDLDEFLNKVKEGECVSNDEILNFAKLFNDQLTVDNMSRPHLENMCECMDIQACDSDYRMRFMLRKKLCDIKIQDEKIQAKGVESLSEEKLRQACRERGYLGLLSTEEMRQQLRDWLDLSINHAMPSSLFILSRAFIVSGKIKPEEAVVATLSSLPDEVVDTVGTALPSEDSVSERRRKLEFFEMQEKLVKEEEKKKGKEEKAKQKKEEKAKLKEEKIGPYNAMIGKEGADGEEAKRAYMAAREETGDTDEVSAEEKVSSALIEKGLEKEIDDVDAQNGNRWQLLDRHHDCKVTPEEVAAAAADLKDTIVTQGVQVLISNLSKDKEGKILVEDIVKLASETDENNEDQEE